MNRREEEETKIIKNAIEEIDIETAMRLRLDFLSVRESGELGLISHDRKRKPTEVLCNMHNSLNEELALLLG